jgi:hypothetical protein
MKAKPMLSDFELDGIHSIESFERRALAEHRVPGLAGSYLQDMGSEANLIIITGSKNGDDARDAFLEKIRELFNAGAAVTFTADINTATDLTDVLIEDLQVAEVGASADAFRYVIMLRKYVKPPEPPATGGLDAGILSDAESMMDTLSTIDQLGSISDIGNPTEPLSGAVDDVQTATSSLPGIVQRLSALFG